MFVANYDDVSSLTFTQFCFSKRVQSISSQYVPERYVRACFSDGSVTLAVHPSGMVKVHIHLSPSNFHSLRTGP